MNTATLLWIIMKVMYISAAYTLSLFLTNKPYLMFFFVTGGDAGCTEGV